MDKITMRNLTHDAPNDLGASTSEGVLFVSPESGISVRCVEFMFNEDHPEAGREFAAIYVHAERGHCKGSRAGIRPSSVALRENDGRHPYVVIELSELTLFIDREAGADLRQLLEEAGL